MQSKLPWVQLQTIFSSIAYPLGEETDLQMATASFWVVVE